MDYTNVATLINYTDEQKLLTLSESEKLIQVTTASVRLAFMNPRGSKVMDESPDIISSFPVLFMKL